MGAATILNLYKIAHSDKSDTVRRRIAAERQAYISALPRLVAIRFEPQRPASPPKSSAADASANDRQSRIKKTPALGLGAVEVFNRACGNLFVHKQIGR